MAVLANGTDELSASIVEISRNAGEAAQTIATAAQRSSDVARSVSGGAQAALTTQEGIAQVKTSAIDVAGLAAGLQKVLTEFRL